MADIQHSSLTDSSSDDSSEDFSTPKRSRMDSPHHGFGVDIFPGSGSTDSLSPGVNRMPLSSDNENIASKMMKEMKPKVFVDDKAQKMMEKMGYRAGKGLGKHSQGMVDPVEVSRQRGRRGLGLHLPGLEAADIQWNSNLEVIKVQEDVFWLEEKDHTTLTDDQLRMWCKEGPRKLNIEDEIVFCDPQVLRQVLSCKSVFDSLNSEELRKSRAKSNPFETIHGAFFLNRAAIKMANMDKVFNHMFTNPVNEKKESLVKQNELLYFADVCAGPGGFSEYVLWRKTWNAKGFGFTLKGENDFSLSDFYAGPSETFEPYYGQNQDGDVFNPDNIHSLEDFVMEQTNGEGVHFMMADGGFSVNGQENIQEILSKQLYLCQCLVALCIVREGGHFVCKLFDLFTPFSVGLVYLMYKSFKCISIHKPNSSRPANSERYIICKWKRKDSFSVMNYLFEVNKKLFKLGSTSKNDIISLVDLSILQDDTEFFNYIVDSNNSLGERQVVNLVKIAAFCRDTSLTESRQAEMRRECLKYWDLPDKARTAPPIVSPDVKCDEILKKDAKASMSNLKVNLRNLQANALEKTFQYIYNWHCVVLASPSDAKTCTFYLGLGRNRTFYWENNKWQKVEGNLELSPETFIYAEMVTERDRKGHHKVKKLHIIDAFVLGGVSVHNKHLNERHSLCVKFAKAHFKPSRPELTQLRVKVLYELEAIDSVFSKLDKIIIPRTGRIPRTIYSLENDKFFIPSGILFIKATNVPWNRSISEKTGQAYYHSGGKKSQYESDITSDAFCNFVDSFRFHYVWWWEEGDTDNCSTKDASKVDSKILLDFVQSRRAKNYKSKKSYN